mgnify:CR=1 FL=1
MQIDKPLRDLARGLRAREFSAADLVREAAENLDAGEPRLGAYKTRTREMAEAGANNADAAFRGGRDIGIFQGIPVSIKDIYGIPGVPIFAGSSRELPAKWQSAGPVARCLLDGLAAVMGKTHTVEFAFGTLGLNAHWPAPWNPWDAIEHRAPGGSSSGAGVSLCEGSAVIALGTDTAGSVRIPASLTGNVGYKPTIGRWSTAGIVPLSPYLDTPGILARTVDDALLAAAQVDRSSGRAQGAIGSAAAVGSLRIGIPEHLLFDDCDPGIAEGVTQALRELERAMLQFDSVQSEARVLTTATGATLTAPFGDDTSNTGAILGENTEISDSDTTFSQWSIGSYLYTSKLIKISWNLLQDSAFDIQAYIAEIAGERVGRILNTHFTTGTGSAQPQGVVTGSTAGATATGSSVIGYDDLINLEHSVPRAYRTNAAKFMFNDATLKALRKLKDADGRPIWQPSLQTGVAPSLNGRQYVINDDMASPAAAAKAVLFGDFKHYIVRKVKGFTLVRLNERYAERLQTGFFVYARFDGKVKDAGKGPIRHLVMKATSP